MRDATSGATLFKLSKYIIVEPRMSSALAQASMRNVYLVVRSIGDSAAGRDRRCRRAQALRGSSW